jgi:hypothetical protein
LAFETDSQRAVVNPPMPTTMIIIMRIASLCLR